MNELALSCLKTAKLGTKNAGCEREITNRNIFWLIYETHEKRTEFLHTVCPKSLNPICVVITMKIKTSWTS